jgi:tetratricopeptide (TPR) repeat protein/tRNA A-37 threonylcarbamoyl transferase component Bud32
MRQVFGPFRVLEAIGAGGMGRVYRAVHQGTGALAALKVAKVHRQEQTAALRREIAALARLGHPGVASILAHGLEDGVPWYAMELVPGQTFRRCMAEQPRRAALALLHKVCEPLGYLHGEGVVHGDLKPDNIIVTPDGRPVVLDFGLTGRLSTVSGREAIDVDEIGVGTVTYSAPEQLLGELVDPRADLYALGCILYEVLTGWPPFRGATVNSVIEGHLHRAPEPPSRSAADVPPALDDLVARLLAKRCADRPGYADAVARVLAPFAHEASGLDVGTPPASAARSYLYRPGFTGRDRLLSSLERSLDGGALALVEGESGIGKTRLALELARRARRRGARVLSGECVPGGATLSPLGRPLLAIADRCREFGAVETERLLGPRLGLLALYEPSMAGLSQAVAAVDPLPPPDRAERAAQEAIVATLLALAEEAPVLLILDDLQWADPVTIGLLDLLRQRPHPGRLGVLGLFRREETSDALAACSRAEGAHVVALPRLDEDSIRSVVADMLATAPPSEFIRWIARRAEGNPFFVAEYLRTAVAERLVQRDEQGVWNLRVPEHAVWSGIDLPIPRSIRDLVFRHLETISPPARRLCDAAAVLGRELRPVLLARLCRESDDHVAEALAELGRRHLVDEVDGALRFAHDKLREVAYDAIGPDQRRRMHADAAAALSVDEPLPRDRLAEIAGHHLRADDVLQGVAWFERAAREANDVGAWPDALSHLNAALDATGRLGPEADAIRARLTFRRGALLSAMGRLDEADADVNRCLGLAKAHGDLVRSVEALISLAFISYQRGHGEGTLSRALEAELAARSVGDARLQGRVHHMLGIAYGSRGDFQRAIREYERAVAFAEQIGEVLDVARRVVNIGLNHRLLGAPHVALSCFARALAIAEERGSSEIACYVYAERGWALLDLGALADAEGAFAHAKELAEASQMTAYALDAQLGSAHVALALGDLAEAQRHARAAHERAQFLGYAVKVGVALRVLGRLAAARGETGDEGAERLLERSLAALRDTPAIDEYAETLVAVAAEVRAREPARARALLDEANAHFERLGMKHKQREP